MEAVAWQPRDEENTRMVDGATCHLARLRGGRCLVRLYAGH